MKLDLITKKQDEFYTPQYAIKPLIKYLKKYKTIWCPFDTEDSYFVKILREQGHEVLATHIWNGENFFEMNIPRCDCIVSNPPYSLKTEVLQKLFEMEKPFAMLVGVVGLFESKERFEMFKNNNFEIMYFNKRIAYFKDYKEQKPCLNPPFSSVYICHKILPEKIVFEYVDKDDNKKKKRR